MELQNQAVLIVGAEVARNYFELRGIEDQLAVARRNLKNQAELLELMRTAFSAGLSAELDVERQSAVLSSLDAAIPLLELQRSLRLHRLAVLLADREFSSATACAGVAQRCRLPAGWDRFGAPQTAAGCARGACPDPGGGSACSSKPDRSSIPGFC